MNIETICITPLSLGELSFVDNKINIAVVIVYSDYSADLFTSNIECGMYDPKPLTYAVIDRVQRKHKEVFNKDWSDIVTLKIKDFYCSDILKNFEEMCTKKYSITK